MRPGKSLMIKSREKNESNFAKIKNSTKNAIFGILYTLTKDLRFPPILMIILAIIEHLQFISLSLHKSLQSLWTSSNKQNESIINSLYTALIKLQIANYYENNISQISFLITLYIIFAFNLLIIAIAVYIAYSFNRGFFSLLWPISLLRFIIMLLMTILFVPILRYEVGIFQCENGFNIFAREIKCYSGYHFVHIIANVISMIITCVVNGIAVICFYNNYNYTKEKENLFIRRNAKSEIFKFFIKIVIVILFAGLDSNDNLNNTVIWFIIILLNLFSVNNFVIFIYGDAYCNSVIHIFYTTLASIYAWENLCLFISKFMNYMFAFEGGIYLFLFGIALIIVIMIFSNFSAKSKVFKMFTIDFAKVTKGEDVEIQMRIFIDLVTTRAYNRESQMILRSIIKNHMCLFNECPLRSLRSGTLLSCETFEKSIQVTTLLLSFISRNYTRAIAKFPNCISLRIEYIQFLFVHQNQRLKALNEIDNLCKNPLSFESEFIVFKIKKMILDVQDTSSNSTAQNSAELLDGESSVAYDSHYRQCQSSILVSSKLFLDFWGMLANASSTPDVYKLNALGEKINDCLKNINNHWNRMQHYKPNDPKALKMYLAFVGQILNNKDKAKEILSLAKGNTAMINGNDNMNNNGNNIQKKIEAEYKDELSLGNGIICISAENENFGTILKATANVSVIFGYLLSDIIGRNIDDFFIEAYSGGVSKHIRERYLKNENAINNNNNNDSSPFNSSEKLFYGKSHNAKINPIYLTVLTATAVNEKMQIKLIVRKQSLPSLSTSQDDTTNMVSTSPTNYFVNKAIFLINSNLQIGAYNEDASILVNITNGHFSHDNYNLAYYFPEILRNDIVANSANIYRIADTVLIEMIIENIKNANNIDNTPAMRDVYFAVRRKKKRNIIGAYNFFEKEKNANEQPVFAKLHIEIFDENEYAFNIPQSSNRTNRQSEFNATESIVSPSSNYANFETIYEALKDKMFVVYCEYSIAEQVEYGKKNLLSDNSLNIFERPLQNKHKNFSEKMIDSPFLRINLDKILDEIEDEKKAQTVSPNKKKKNAKENVINSNIMSYLKDKGKFAKLYDFEGIDIEDYNLQSEKEFAGKTLTEIKRKSAFINGKKSEQISPNTKLKRQSTSKFNQGNNSQNVSEESEDEGIDEFDLSGVDFTESKNLLSIHSEINATQLKTKIEQLKNYSEGVSLCLYQNDNLTSVKQIQPTQISVFLQMQENASISSSHNEKTIFSSTSASMTNANNSSNSNSKFSQNVNNNMKNSNLKSLSHLRISSFVTVSLLVLYNIINFILNANANDKTERNLSLIDASYIAVNQISYSTYFLRNLLLTSNSQYTNYLNNPSKESFIEANIANLSLSQSTLDEIITQISNSGLRLSNEHRELIADSIVPVYFLDEIQGSYYNQNRTLIQAMSDMRIYILTIANYPNSSLDNNTLVNNLMYNSFNDFYSELRRSAALYANLFIDNDSYYTVVFIIMFVIIIVIAISEIIVMSKMLIKVDGERTKILCAFYEIPQEYISDLSKKCIKFIEKNEKIKNYNNGNNANDSADGDSDETEEENEDLVDSEFDAANSYENIEDKRKKHQRIKNIREQNQKENRKTIIKVFITFLIVVCVFIVDFSKNITMFNDLDSIITIFNITAQTESQYLYSMNILREKILDLTFITQNTANLSILNETISNDYILNNELLVYAIKTTDYFSNQITKTINSLLNSNICSYINTSYISCDTEMDGIGNYGVAVITVRFLEYLRLATKAYVNKLRFENSYEILSGTLLKDITLLMHYYLSPLYNLLRQEIKQGIEDKLKFEMNFRLILFIVFLVVVIFAYLLVWIPKQNKINDEIFRTKKLLEIIPMEILEKIESLKQKE